MIIMEEEDTLLTLNEVAAMLRVTTNTARTYVRDKKFQVIRVGGRIRIRKSAVNRYLAKNTVEGK